MCTLPLESSTVWCVLLVCQHYYPATAAAGCPAEVNDCAIKIVHWPRTHTPRARTHTHTRMYVCMYVYTWVDHLIPGLFFFVSELADLAASWSCLLQSSVLVLVRTYSSVPATDEITFGSHLV